ncbi:MAG: Tn3 family transposase [Isosphaeraceae bacterium]
MGTCQIGTFAEGTNTGIRRVANANDRYSYDELLYVRKAYLSPEALRNANGAVVNKLLALRNPRLWGEGASSCAPAATRFESWKQNPMTEWRSRYKGYGVMVLFYCALSQLPSRYPSFGMGDVRSRWGRGRETLAQQRLPLRRVRQSKEKTLVVGFPIRGQRPNAQFDAFPPMWDHDCQNKNRNNSLWTIAGGELAQRVRRCT